MNPASGCRGFESSAIRTSPTSLYDGPCGLYFELAPFRAVFPGHRRISLILAFYSFQDAPGELCRPSSDRPGSFFSSRKSKVAVTGFFRWRPSFSLTLGSIMLFEDVGVSLRLRLQPFADRGVFVIVSTLAFRAYHSKPQSGIEGLMGRWRGKEAS